MHWDYEDQLRQVDKGGGGAAFYVYDASGQRVRKVWEKSGVTEERIYLGGFEIFRQHGGAIGAGSATLERETLHVMDDKQCIALIETRTLGGEPGIPRQLIRYQFGNHLGSASLELDETAQIISYEEYSSYGSSTYQAVRSQTETAKRYRYTGKERDEESGFYYHGARYYAAWLGRWTSCDPIFDQDYSSFSYVRSRPTLLRDSNGRDPDLPDVVGKPPSDCRGKKCHTSHPSASRGWTGSWSDIGTGAAKAAKNLALDVLQGAAIAEAPIGSPEERVLELYRSLEELRPDPPKNDSEWLGFFLADAALASVLGPETIAERAEVQALKEATVAQRAETTLAQSEAATASAKGSKQAAELEQRAAKELERLENLEAKTAAKEAKFTDKFKGFRAKPFLVPTALQEKVQKLHAALDKIAQSRKTTALGIVETPDGLKVVVASSDKNVPWAIKDLAQQEGIEIVQGTGHAEATIIDAAKSRGWNLKAIAPSRDFCANCWFKSLATDAELMGSLKDRAFSGKK
jgi:RHS repeat-associated protein